MNTIHIVDDDSSILDSLRSILESEAYTVITADSPKKFYVQIKNSEPAVVILDIFFGEGEKSGDEIIAELVEQFPYAQIIVISGESDVHKTIACLKNGALDFLEKPVSLPRLITSVKNAFNIYDLRKNAMKKHRILGDSLAIKKVIHRLKKLALLNESVLISGENGTGKELIAENLHQFSNNYTKTMNKVNCTSLNPNLIESELFGHRAGSFTGAQKDKKGYFEQSHNSTLFIDEIGDFDLSLQGKILRVLQEKKVIPVGATEEIDINVRLLFATHRELDTMIEKGTFREDLYFRISTFTIVIPPLRERIDDVDILAKYFLQNFIIDNKLQPKDLAPEALEKLKGYHYPGNIRELAKIIKNAAFFCVSETIVADDISFDTRLRNNDAWIKTRSMSLADAKNYLEKELLKNRLQQTNNNIQKCSESLGILRNNLYRKLREHNIQL